MSPLSNFPTNPFNKAFYSWYIDPFSPFLFPVTEALSFSVVFS